MNIEELRAALAAEQQAHAATKSRLTQATADLETTREVGEERVARLRVEGTFLAQGLDARAAKQAATAMMAETSDVTLGVDGELGGLTWSGEHYGSADGAVAAFLKEAPHFRPRSASTPNAGTKATASTAPRDESWKDLDPAAMANKAWESDVADPATRGDRSRLDGTKGAA